MNKLFFTFSLIILLFSGCNEASNGSLKTIDVASLEGDWELTQEVFNNQTFDCTDNPIKTVLTLKENGYFIYFDDLTNSGLIGDIDKIQVYLRGQYTFEENILTLNQTENSEESSETFEVKSVDKKELVLVNIDSTKELHYKKR